MLKLLAWWTGAWIVAGAAAGVVMGFGDTGHVGLLGVVLQLIVLAAIFGLVSGLVFSPLSTWLAPRAPARTLRVAGGSVLGAVSGTAGGYVADLALSVTHALAVGTVAGVIAGLWWGVLSHMRQGAAAELRRSTTQEAIRER